VHRRLVRRALHRLAGLIESGILRDRRAGHEHQQPQQQRTHERATPRERPDNGPRKTYG